MGITESRTFKRLARLADKKGVSFIAEPSMSGVSSLGNEAQWTLRGVGEKAGSAVDLRHALQALPNKKR